MAVNQVRAGAILGFATIAVNNIVGLVYTPYMLRMLGQTEYGLYSLVASIITYLTILDLGFGNAIIRYASGFIAENKKREQEELYGMFLKLYCIIGFVALILGLLLYANVDYFFNRTMTSEELHQTRIMMLMLVVNVAVTFPMSIWGSILVAHERFVFIKVVNILRIVLNAAVMVILLSVGYKAVTMVLVLTLFNISTLIANYVYCHRLKIKCAFIKVRWSFLREVLSYSMWIFLAGIVDRFYWSTGQFIIGMYDGPDEIAKFGVAVQLQGFYSSFAFALSGVLFPKIVKMVTNKSSISEISNLFIKTGRLQLYVMSLVFTGFILFGKQFIMLWAGNNYIESFDITLILFCAILLSSIQQIGQSILQALNLLQFRTLVIFFVSLGAVIISFFITKRFGGIGCAACISGGIILGHILILNIYYSLKVGLAITRFWRNMLKIGLTSALLCYSGFLILSFFHSLSLPAFLLAIVVYSVVYIGIMYVVNFNHEEKNLIKSGLMKLKFA